MGQAQKLLLVIQFMFILRTIVQDYYDDRLYRGFAVYYGVRSSAPTGSTGLVGDLWVSW